MSIFNFRKKEAVIISEEDKTFIKKAKDEIENISYLMQGLNVVGSKLDILVQKLPEKTVAKISVGVEKSLKKVVKLNLTTMKSGEEFKAPSNKTYKAVVMASGAVGGFFGAATFIADLVVATKFMMRSILDIARSHGEDINNIESQLACMEVFALGGASKMDDNLDTGYYATRMALKTAVEGASRFVTKNGASKTLEQILVSSAGPISKLIGQIAGRFTPQVLEKFVAQATPIAGAVGGSSVNLIFMDHFQRIAGAHFTIRKLERKYGEEAVKAVYNE